jgi:hypothetical protein
MLLPMKNEARDFTLLRQKKKEIFRRPDSYRNIFLKNLRASAKVYTPHFLGAFACMEKDIDQCLRLKHKDFAINSQCSAVGIFWDY